MHITTRFHYMPNFSANGVQKKNIKLAKTARHKQKHVLEHTVAEKNLCNQAASRSIVDSAEAYSFRTMLLFAKRDPEPEEHQTNTCAKSQIWATSCLIHEMSQRARCIRAWCTHIRQNGVRNLTVAAIQNMWNVGGNREERMKKKVLKTHKHSTLRINSTVDSRRTFLRDFPAVSSREQHWHIHVITIVRSSRSVTMPQAAASSARLCKTQHFT